MRQPVMEKYLLKLAKTIASRLVSQALRASRPDPGVPSAYSMPW